jgi:hypothetical protein
VKPGLIEYIHLISIHPALQSKSPTCSTFPLPPLETHQESMIFQVCYQLALNKNLTFLDNVLFRERPADDQHLFGRYCQSRDLVAYTFGVEFGNALFRSSVPRVAAKRACFRVLMITNEPFSLIVQNCHYRSNLQHILYRISGRREILAWSVLGAY